MWRIEFTMNLFKKFNLIILLLILISSNSCVKPYKPPSSSTSNKLTETELIGINNLLVDLDLESYKLIYERKTSSKVNKYWGHSDSLLFDFLTIPIALLTASIEYNRKIAVDSKTERNMKENQQLISPNDYYTEILINKLEEYSLKMTILNRNTIIKNNLNNIK